MKLFPWLPSLACWLLAGLYLLSGVEKVLNPASFAEAIHHYRLLPWPLSAGLSLYLPWFELVLAISLLLRGCRRTALVLSSLLLLVFSVALTSALARGLDIRCGCFGTLDSEAPLWVALLRSLALGALCLWAFVASRPRRAASES